MLKRLEEEDLDEGVRRRLKDSSETPGALWHIYLSRDMDKVQEFLHKVGEECGFCGVSRKIVCGFSSGLIIPEDKLLPSSDFLLLQLCKEQGLNVCLDQDPIREQGWYLSRKQRQRLLEEHGVQGWTVVQFLGDSVLIPAGAMHQVRTEPLRNGLWTNKGFSNMETYQQRPKQSV